MVGRRTYTLLVAVLATTAGAFAVPVQAQAWTTALSVSPSGHVTGLIGAGVGPDGKGVIGWQLNDQSPGTVGARIQHADGSLGGSRTIASNAAPYSAVFEMNGGMGYFVWRGWDGSNYRVQLRTLSTTGVLGPTITVSQENKDASCCGAAFGVDAAGNAVAVWQNNDRNILVRTVAANGSLGPISVLTPQGQSFRNPVVAVDATGDSVIMWSRSDNDQAQFVQRQSDGTLGSVADLNPNGGDYDVVSDPAGDSVMTYLGNGRIFARTLSSTGTLGPEKAIGDEASNLAFLRPSVAVDDGGAALIAWQSPADAIKARTLTTSGTRGPTQLIASTGIRPDLGEDSVGNAFIGWSNNNKTNPQTYVRQRAPSGTLGPRQAMTGPRLGGAPLVGLNDNGQAIAAWQDGGDRVWGSVGP